MPTIHSLISLDEVLTSNYMQITVIAETHLLDINTNNLKQKLLSADVVCIDALSSGILHIECMFNNSFRKVGI